MSELDIVKGLAKQTLRIPTPTSDIDNSLWDRAQRLVRNVERISQLPEVAKAGLQIDRFCLAAAAYFSESGLASHLKAKNTTTKSAVSDANDEDLRGFSTQLAAENLSTVIDKARIEKINKIITESGSNFTGMIEAMVLSDARSLDDMGAAGIFNEFRRHAIGGKGVSDAVQSWKRKIDYRYWEGRLEKSFRFDSVHKVAKNRVSTAEEFMRQLKNEANGRDLEEFVLESMEIS